MSNPTKNDGQDKVEDSKPSSRAKATVADERAQKVQQGKTATQKRSPTAVTTTAEEIKKQDWIDGAFAKTTALLEDLPAVGARFLAPMPSVVALHNAVVPPPPLPMIFATHRNRDLKYSSNTVDILSAAGTLGGENIDNSNSNNNNDVEADSIGEGSSTDPLFHGVNRGVLSNAGAFRPAMHRERGNQGMDGNGSITSSSLLTPNRGQHALFQNLEDLEGFDKLESELQLRSPLTTNLTTIATADDVCYQNPREAVNTLEALSRSVPRRVCQHPFKKNDIVWVCRTCQADETCVLCHACFKGSNHEGHDVAFYHAQAGGCCDCGDPDAWDPAGFCGRHGPAASASNNFMCTIIGAANDETNDGLPKLGPLSGSIVFRVQGIVPAAVDWMVKHVASAAEEGFLRTEEEEKEQSQSSKGEEGELKSQSSPEPSQPQLGSPQSSEEVDVEMRDSSDVISTSTSQAVSSFKSDSSSLKHPGAATIRRRRIFSPTAAGKSRRQDINEKPLTEAEKLGMLARQGGGLYLVLKSDDIHTDRQLIDAIHQLFGTDSVYTEATLTKVVQALRQFGQLIVWGTTELLTELTRTQVQLWLDGDRVASGVFGAAMLHRAKILTRTHGLFFSIMTRRELQVEQRAVNVLQWLTGLARSCDPLCQKVAESISPDRHLAPLLRADFKLSSRVTKYWHSLLLTLLAVPTFKSHLAVAYCDTYQSVTAEYARGMGVLERSGYALSVQFLNRVTYVLDLVQRRDLLGKLGASLFQTLNVAAVPVTENEGDSADNDSTTQDAVTTPSGDSAADTTRQQRRLNPVHFVMMNRRYSPCISDLKCVLNVKGMPRLFATKSGCFLKDWIAALGLGQMMDPQIWRERTQGHIELEHRGWVGAFNASISLGSLFERLLSWDDSDPSPIQDPNSPMSKNLMTCVELTFHVLTTGVYDWQNLAISTYKPMPHNGSLELHKHRSASLPFSTLASNMGSVLAFRALPISQMTPFSFHLPLHRFVAACLREACLRETGIRDLRMLLSKNLTHEVQDKLFLGLMEFPLLVLSRAAQVRAGLWRRNGNGLNDQVLNYAEPPFCRAMRDADLLLIQFAMLGRIQTQTGDRRPDSDVGVCFLVHLLLHRLGLFDFCGLAKAPNTNVNRYFDEVQKGLYPPENDYQENWDDISLPTTYSPARDSAAHFLLLEEFLHAIIIICKELPPEPPIDKVAHTNQAKLRLRREVIHRLASGPKTHSEMAEVHHVLSHWDNVYLSEEGKKVNPDDATGAALMVVLAEVANRKVSRRTMEPDKWELNREAWESYDPSFYHINLRNHQTAAESRPAFPSDNKFRVKPKPFCPALFASHPDFTRLRRDVTCDAAILAITYRTLHMHIRDNKKRKESVELRGAMAYEGDDKSETAVARAVHLLTLGAYAWQDASTEDKNWRKNGGGSIGSIFFDHSDNSDAPTVKEWISAALLANPKLQQASDWYEGEENCLQLLRRLAVDGGYDGCFFAQDRAVQAGAAWLCEFAARHNSEASKLVYLKEPADCVDDSEKQETELERRKRFAKQKAMERMKAQAAKFAFAMQDELDEKDEKDESGKIDVNQETSATPMSRRMSLASHLSSSSLTGSEDALSIASPDALQCFDEPQIPMRLLKCRPQCIICSDDSNAEKRTKEREDLGSRHNRRRRSNGGNALAFVGYTQASTVMKGGGGPSMSGDTCSFVPVKRFVGAHVALCGHAIHSECWESYLATISRREDRRVSKKDEFRCPLCQRLSNCLVPFIDVGSDWIDPAATANSVTSLDKLKSDDKEDAMSCESTEGTGSSSSSSSQKFLDSTPWWVSRHNDSVTWDGQCAFVSNKRSATKAELKPGLSPVPRRRSVRSLRKKDLTAAWNAMMKTPRFVRRKLRSKSETKGGNSGAQQNIQDDLTIAPLSSTESAAETVVWRRFMDQVSDITYKADGRRLGDENLHKDFGEFRHYIVEKYSYNSANKYANKEPLDWPSCVFPTTLYETQRQELSREKLLSKLMMSIQSLTYSICCETNEARRLIRMAKIKATRYAGSRSSSDDKSMNAIFSKYGIANILCNGKLIVLPRPNTTEDDGFQPFNGRLGRLRYFSLAVMATAGAVAADLVQLVIGFPLHSAIALPPEPYRSPIVYPILYGNVLTHVVAAICASGGRARARSDSLEIVWPISFCSRGSFISSNSTNLQKKADSIVDDSEGFIKLGLLARVLQVLLGKIGIPDTVSEAALFETVRKMREAGFQEISPESKWTMHCLSLLEMALVKHRQPGVQNTSQTDEDIAKRIEEGCSLAAEAACSFLADIGIILQLLVPGIMARYIDLDNIEHRAQESDDTFTTLVELQTILQLEPLSEILESDAIRQVVSNWYETARNHTVAKSLPSKVISRSGAMVTSLLYKSQGFRVYDWPMESCRDVLDRNQSDRKRKEMDTSVAKDKTEGTPMDIDSPVETDVLQTNPIARSPAPTPLVSFSSKKSVKLIGGYTPDENPILNNNRPRVSMMPTSYTDLYAELSQLLPDSEQTAVCLVCGEVLNAGGRGECTRHSYKCGAGAGMFFLLQECAGLIMHNGKAAYIHSPYVDSHGETPQYRGRPLNLDLDRYAHLHEVWSGHNIRQQVLAERESSRQIIVDNFY